MLIILKLIMNEKTVIITGCSNPTGKEAVIELAGMGAKVILACRNLERGEQIKDEIIEATKNENVILKKIDLSSQKSIREFADDINDTESRLDVLIHNAAIFTTKNLLSEDGLELTMAVNHFGPFLLTHLLIDLLKKSSPSRIIVTSSICHIFSCVNSKNLNNGYAIVPSINYMNSKFANICFTRELSRRLKGTSVTVNCLNPGIINTELWKIPLLPKWMWDVIFKPFLQISSEGCNGLIYLATAKEAETVSGKYFYYNKISYACKRAYSHKTCSKIWRKTQKILKFKESDYVI